MYMPWSQDGRPAWRVTVQRAAVVRAGARPERDLTTALLRTRAVRSPRVQVNGAALTVVVSVRAEGHDDAVLAALRLLAVAAARVDGLALGALARVAVHREPDS